MEARCCTKTPGEGGGGPFLTSPAQLLRGCEEDRVGYLWAATCLAQARSMERVGWLCLRPASPAIPGLPLPATGCPSCPDQSSRCMPGWRDRSPSRSKWNYVEQEADFKNTAQARASLVTPDPVCKALPVILHLVVLFRKERTKFALPKSGKSWGAGGHMVLM